MKMKLIIILTLILLALGALPCSASTFSDMIGNDMEAIVDSLAAEGVIYGVTETTFNPNGKVTRAEFSAMIVRAMGYEEADYQNYFSDVSADDWFAGSVATLSQRGIINGYDNAFYPNDYITNEQMAKIMVCLFEAECGPIRYQGGWATFMQDYYSISLWARDYVNKAVMINGVRTLEAPKDVVALFKPQNDAIRSAAAEVIYNVRNTIRVVNQQKGE